MVINLSTEKLKSIQIKLKKESYDKADNLAKVLREKHNININKNELLGNLAEEALETATFNLDGKTLTANEILESANAPEENVSAEENTSTESNEEENNAE